MESSRIKRHLDRLMLDPNNYRFIDRPEYRKVADESLIDERVQQRTFNFITGKDNENIKDLIASITTNGFLPIEQIPVRALGDYFIVLEGNRRISTLKYLYEEFKKGNDVGKLTESDFKSIEVVLIEGDDPVNHLLTMGLQHISGKKRWSPLNEAKLIADLQKEHNMSVDDICDSLGISKQKLRRSTRTLALIEQYRDSDFGDQFETNMYSLFETVVGNPAMKEWVGWDDGLYKATNDVNLHRFFSWISETDECETDEDGNNHPNRKEPIISQYRQIKDVANFITDEKALRRMEESRSISEGYSLSDEVGETKLRNALWTLQNEVKTVFNFSEFMKPEDYVELAKFRDKFDKLVPLVVVNVAEKEDKTVFSSASNHFTNICIESYRKLENITISRLSRVNIFAGGNNNGKTSMLEAIFLLSQLNDINALFELERFRGKFYNDFQPKWLAKNVCEYIKLSGLFEETNVDLTIRKQETSDDIDKTGYLTTIQHNASVAEQDLESFAHLFENREPDLRYHSIRALCRGSLTSPYRHNIELLCRAHQHAVKEKYFDDIISFIRNKMDTTIQKIEMVENNRFMVTSSRFETAVDITKYGEGMQRVFEIALLMGYNNAGILCIDEIDCALHKSLLSDFAQFVLQLAVKFNVQVFVSTHSKECIDAFSHANNRDDDMLTAYSLQDEDGRIVSRYADGKRLESLINSIDFDIR